MSESETQGFFSVPYFCNGPKRPSCHLFHALKFASLLLPWPAKGQIYAKLFEGIYNLSVIFVPRLLSVSFQTYQATNYVLKFLPLTRSGFHNFHTFFRLLPNDIFLSSATLFWFSVNRPGTYKLHPNNLLTQLPAKKTTSKRNARIQTEPSAAKYKQYNKKKVDSERTQKNLPLNSRQAKKTSQSLFLEFFLGEPENLCWTRFSSFFCNIRCPSSRLHPNQCPIKHKHTHHIIAPHASEQKDASETLENDAWRWVCSYFCCALKSSVTEWSRWFQQLVRTMSFLIQTKWLLTRCVSVSVCVFKAIVKITLNRIHKIPLGLIWSRMTAAWSASILRFQFWLLSMEALNGWDLLVAVSWRVVNQ